MLKVRGHPLKRHWRVKTKEVLLPTPTPKPLPLSVENKNQLRVGVVVFLPKGNVLKGKFLKKLIF